MKKQRGLWVCGNCGFPAADAYLHAIRDYALLIHNTAAGSDLQAFLEIPSRTTAYRVFSGLQLPRSGSTKGARYQLPLK
ncbi:hypothetical protein [Ectobacillus ponti]|uniref:Uncharacterized protein n=1 Tax=Ectobacillus ponti TaxID=2961894 RepID=A0AA41X8E6_9BACI|nr:hypothetical protein [Ectobacillus ponti]MCP8970682.1 hypothetical protein [Ectobacillus ponti]